ncbi:MAG: Tim44 domain-containing protein, partial [Candidatus Binatia bacterium]
MKISKEMALTAVGLFAIIGLSQIVLEMDADARAGGGRSGGFRGSRSFQAPSRPSQPAQPRREATPPPQQAGQMAPQSGGFMRGLGTAVLGGF